MSELATAVYLQHLQKEMGMHEEVADEEEMPPDLIRALKADPTLGGKLHDIHGGPGEDCWCGYIGHDPPVQKEMEQ